MVSSSSPPLLIAKSEFSIINKVNFSNFTLIIAVIYFRLEPNLTLNNILLEIQQIVINIQQEQSYDLFLIGGDLNARVGNSGQIPEETVEYTLFSSSRPSLDLIHNSQGKLLMSFMTGLGLIF